MTLPVPGAARALAVFETFAREKRELSNTELARALGLPESSCSDLVATLMECGYLDRSAKSRRLYPTGKLPAVASAFARESDVERLLAPRVEALRDATGETALAGRLAGHAVLVLAASEARFPLRYSVAAGEKLALHVSAMGKAILAQQPLDEAMQVLGTKPLRKLASQTPVEPKALRRQLAEFAKLGYALVENEGAEDLAALAVAGAIEGEAYAISLAGPVGRLRMNFDANLRALRRAAKELFGPAGSGF